MTVVVVPFVAGMMHPDTGPAVTGCGLPSLFAQIPGSSPEAYGLLIRNLWARCADFIICEQDVVPTVAQLRGLAGCHHDWCSYQYADNRYPAGPQFGLCRFSARVQVERPALAELALTTAARPSWEGRLCEDAAAERWEAHQWTRAGLAKWWAVDVQMARALRAAGVKWGLHSPPVVHHHRQPTTVP